jgi:hypothetical protein
MGILSTIIIIITVMLIILIESSAFSVHGVAVIFVSPLFTRLTSLQVA